MTRKNEYIIWSKKFLKIKEGTKRQYITSIENLSNIVGFNIFETDDTLKINELYEDLIRDQKNVGGKYYSDERPSSSLKGWYSASVKTYLDF